VPGTLHKIKTSEIHNDITHEYETFIINLIAIKSEIISGTPIPKEHSKLIWLKLENLVSLVWAPADIPAVKLLLNKR
jgi:8-oxo-dGTP diphosphatase